MNLFDQMFPNPNQQLEMLTVCFENLYEEQNMESFTLKVCCILNDISSEIKTNPNQPFIFQVAPNEYLHTCLAPFKTDQCQLFTIQQRITERQMCYNCDGDSKRELIRLSRRKKTKVVAGESGILPSSTTKFSTLSPSEMAKRYQLSQN